MVYTLCSALPIASTTTKKMNRATLIIATAILLCSCQQAQRIDSDAGELSYARGFTINHTDDYTTVEVRNPWDTLHLLKRYILVDRDRELPTSTPEGIVVRTPVEKIAISTAIDAGALDLLDATKTIVALCEAEYISDTTLIKGVSSGKITDLGQATMPSAELLIASRAEAIIVSPFQNQGYGAIEKSKTAIIECASYTENSPLGRAEWIKFYAAFLGKSQCADSLFEIEVKRYNDLKSKVADVTERPAILPGKSYKQTWYVSGGDSYAAKLYIDAGASYPWIDEPGDISIPLSFEVIASRNREFDIWLIPYYDHREDITLEALKEEHKPYAQLKPYINKRVYGVNTAQKKLYEQTPFAPSLYLEDIIRIVHPDILEPGEMRYFKIVE